MSNAALVNYEVEPATEPAPQLAIYDEPTDEPPSPVSFGSLYIDHRVKLTGPGRYDAAIEAVGMVFNEDAQECVLYKNLKDGTYHVTSLASFIEPCEIKAADGLWYTVPRFIKISE